MNPSKIAPINREKENRVPITVNLNLTDDSDKTNQILKARAVALAQELNIEMPTNTIEVLIFELTQEQFAFESQYIQEVYTLKEYTLLPCTPAFVLGIINVRGQIISIIDIKKFFEYSEKDLTCRNKVIILSSKSLTFGVLVDEIIGTESVALSEIQTSLTTLTGIRAAYLKGITADRLVILDAKKLMNDKNIIVHEQV